MSETVKTSTSFNLTKLRDDIHLEIFGYLSDMPQMIYLRYFYVTIARALVRSEMHAIASRLIEVNFLGSNFSNYQLLRICKCKQ